MSKLFANHNIMLVIHQDTTPCMDSMICTVHLTRMCTNTGSGSSEAGALSDLHDSGKTPSSRWVLDKLRAIDGREILDRCDHGDARVLHVDMKKASHVQESCCCGDRRASSSGLVRHRVRIRNTGPAPSRKTGRAGFTAWPRCTTWPADPRPRLGQCSSRKRIMTPNVVM